MIAFIDSLAMSSRGSWHAIQDCYPTCPITSHCSKFIAFSWFFKTQTFLTRVRWTPLFLWTYKGMQPTKVPATNICFSWQANLLQRLEEGKRALAKESARRASSCRTAIPAFASLKPPNARRIQSFRHFKAWRWDDVLEGCAGPDWLLGMLPKGSWLWWKACLKNPTLSWTLSQLLIETAWSFTRRTWASPHESKPSVSAGSPHEARRRSRSRSQRFGVFFEGFEVELSPLFMDSTMDFSPFVGIFLGIPAMVKPSLIGGYIHDHLSFGTLLNFTQIEVGVGKWTQNQVNDNPIGPAWHEPISVFKVIRWRNSHVLWCGIKKRPNIDGGLRLQIWELCHVLQPRCNWKDE